MHFSFSTTALLNISLIPVLQAQTITITESPAYSSLRPCAQGCFRYQFGGLANEIGCQNSLDSCFCRTDLHSSATSFLSTCVNYFCKTNAADLSSAKALFETYCSKTAQDTAATPTGPASTLVTTTSGVGSPSATLGPIVTSPPTSTLLSTPISSTSTTSSTPMASETAQSGSLWTPDKIAGIIVGIISGVIALPSAIVALNNLRLKRSGRHASTSDMNVVDRGTMLIASRVTEIFATWSAHRRGAVAVEV